MDKISQLFLYIPGIIIFLVGSGQVRSWMRRRRPGASTVGDVESCNHIVKRDKKDREVYNYYNVMVAYTDPQNHHRVRRNFKAPNEYAVGQQVRRFWGTDAEQAGISEKEEEALFDPWVMMIGGALLILLALFQNRGDEVKAMICLAVVLAGAGVSLLWQYFKLKKKNLQTLTAEIIEIYNRQISKETKILRGSKFTYYPIVKYVIDGRENIRRCNINSSSDRSFKVGETMELYYDAAAGTVYERNAKTGMAVAGLILLIVGILAGISILSVIL